MKSFSGWRSRPAGSMMVVLVIVCFLIAGRVMARSDLQKCEAADFSVSQLRPLLPGPSYLRNMLGTTWKDAVHESADIGTQRRVHCHDTFPYLWKVEFNGDVEGAVTALARFHVAGDISESIVFGKVTAVDFNYGDELCVPAMQPTVNVVAEEVERPDASFPDGKYVKLTTSGLLPGSTAVFRVDLRLDCSQPDQEGVTEEQREAAPVEYIGEIVDTPSVMCAESIETDSRGVPTLPFGVRSSRMSMPTVVMRQAGPVAGFTELTVFVKPCPALNCDSDCDPNSFGSGLSLLGNSFFSAGFGGANPVLYPRGDCTSFLFCYIWEGTFELPADYVFYNVTDQVFRVNETSTTFETLRDIEGTDYWGSNWANGAGAFDPQYTFDYFNVGPAGNIQYFGTSRAFSDTIGEITPLISNDIVGVFSPDDVADCDCISTGMTVSTLVWSCGAGATGTVSDLCTNSGNTYDDFRCIEPGEIPTGDCFFSERDTCVLNAVETETGMGSVFRCNVLSGPRLEYFPYNQMCTNPAMSPRGL
ncbi:hypothetical protein FVE85_9355 [Porphyridium purpureum]|uniref:Uncharacterized protein n=1 Tax=Porphyridium purpureum TaxID=35688 RepID=A0A5J4YQM3_PORPP|nr:hypothetical protein FVE85_9355 [Porphyridium purpureum]|eukprot:POR9887..scf222_8